MIPLVVSRVWSDVDGKRIRTNFSTLPVFLFVEKLSYPVQLASCVHLYRQDSLPNNHANDLFNDFFCFVVMLYLCVWLACCLGGVNMVSKEYDIVPVLVSLLFVVARDGSSNYDFNDIFYDIHTMYKGMNALQPVLSECIYERCISS